MTELPMPLLPFALLALLASAAFVGVLVTESRMRWWRFRMDRIRIWMALMSKWSAEGMPFEQMRERLIQRVGVEMHSAKSDAARRQLKRAFTELLALWNETVVDEKLGGGR